MTEETKTKTSAEEKPELTLESVNDRVSQMVDIVNNIIMYCNTIEKWRTMSFKPVEKKEESKEEDVISDAEKQE